MSGPIQNIVKKSLNPFIGIGAVCMVCSGAWLISDGHWYALWLATMGLILSPVVYPLLMIPGAFCAGVMMATQKLYPRASKVFSVLAFTWFCAVLSGYTVLSFTLIQDYITADPNALVPIVIWAISAAVTPWGFFFARDRENVFFTGMVYMTALVAVIVIPLSLKYGLSGGQLFWIFWASLGTLVGLQALYEKYLHKTPEVETPLAPAETPAAQDAPVAEDAAAQTDKNP
ncbi:MAG: hypothetical protein RBS08_03205 [Bdellovibrionales bacterium]|jgi:hypothetical protein|nr:hypothetical protein [Bdellovibrionales bacterium]